MSETKEKKSDLTGLLDYSKELQAMGIELHPSAEGDGTAVMSDAPLEKVDAFESLDEYGKTNPLASEPAEIPEALPDAFAETSENPVLDPPTLDASLESISEATFQETPPSEPLENTFEGTLESAKETAEGITEEKASDFPSAEYSPSENLISLPQDFNQTPNSDFALPEVSAPERSFGATDITSIVPPPSFSKIDETENFQPPPLAPAPFLAPPEMPPAPIVKPLENARKLANAILPGQPAVAAQVPFSLRINGFLNSYEKEKLTDLLLKENFGFSEFDLEPQLEAGKILLPRISEYAGILVIQALRGASVQFLFGPSDEVFSSSISSTSLESLESSKDDSQSLTPSPASHSQTFHLEELGLPLITLPLPHSDDSRFQVIETLSVTSILETRDVEVENTSVYLQTVQALKSELQYKAHRKGASAVFGFSLELTPLSSTHPQQYRLTASGVAVITI